MPDYYFFDSSAIAKRYWREKGTDWVRAVCNSRGTQPVLYLSEIAQIEVAAGIRRTGRILVEQRNYHRSAFDAAVSQYENDVQRSRISTVNAMYTFVPLNPRIVQIALQLCNRFWLGPTPSLRSLDAIQLASALVANADAAPAPITFVTADARLESIAQAVGFTTDNPMRYP